MKKMLSILLSIAMIFSMATIMGTTTVGAAEDYSANLLANPEFVSTDGTISGVTGWSINSAAISAATLETDTDGSNYIKLATSNTNDRLELRTTSSLSLASDKYYKFSADVKLQDPPSGDFNINNGVYLAFKYNNKYANRVSLEKCDEWTEFSFVMYGGDVPSGAWDRFFAFVSNYSRATLSIKNPAVTLADPDALNYKGDVEAENLLTNGDFSKYDGTAVHSTTNRFTGFSVAGKANNCVNHEQVTVDLNGKTVTAAKLTYNGTSYDTKDALFNCYSVLSADKYYRISVWLKLDDADVYDEATGQWVTSEGSFKCGEGGAVSFGYQKGNGTPVKSAPVSTNDGWHNISMVVNGADWYTTWQSRVGIWVYRINGNIYLADMRVEELVGAVSYDQAENMLTNGDFASYDAESGAVDSITIENTDKAWYDGHSVETVELNGKETTALKVSINGENESRKIKHIIDGNDLSKTGVYRLTAWVKIAAKEDGSFSNNSNFGGINLCFSHGGADNLGETSINTKGDWQKLSLIINEELHGGKNWWDFTTTFFVGLRVYSMTCDLYIADMHLEEMTYYDLETNRSNANAGDTVEVSASVEDGYILNKLYYTDGTNETVITDKRAEAVTEIAASSNGDFLATKTYDSIATDEIYTFVMPEGVDVTVKALVYQYGDITCDGALDVIDLIRIKKFLADTENVAIDAVNLKTTQEAVTADHIVVIRQLILGVNPDVTVEAVDALTTISKN